ncbi:hypothetical protein ACFOY2_13065 [Nonomuraea purpurea]|uniref:WD40 repeat domain-containing protein n=1 Tax=Nonomuraea purpurea TaxID=1849276 RepID=A0ABV8G747_9ACTN
MVIMNLPLSSAGPEALSVALRGADWPAFAPARDLPPLRAALAELERTHGITEAHRFATERLKDAGAVLRHPDGHPAEINGFALSPCGRYLAIGSWCGDDYERGGALQVWELATARCVNVLDGIEGGVGWPGYVRTIQWSADGQRIALAFNTNGVGLWDPFGEETESIGEAYVTDGSSRPPRFAFAPDGTRAYISVWTPHDVRGCLAPLTEGGVYGDDDVELLPEALPADIKARLEDDGLFFSRAFWSKDGTRLHGYGDDWAGAVDVASGQVVWFADAETRGAGPAWSQDERYVARHLRGQLVFADAMTGRTVATAQGHPGATELSWGSRGTVGRLAVVVPGGGRARPRVAVYDDGWHRYDVDVALMEIDRDDVDGTVWAWSPDGLHAAALTDTGRIEVWHLGDGPVRLRSFAAPEEAFGVAWGADGVLVSVSATHLRFVRAATGETTGDFALLQAPPEPRPLELDGDDIGMDLRDEEEARVDPTFALDDETWAVAFESGLVIAPPDRRAALDNLLAWTFDGRFGWPVRWGVLDVVPDAAAAAERAVAPLAEHLAGFRGRTEAPSGPVAWPPPNTATVEDLFQIASTSVAPLDEGWDHHVSENLRHAARLRARRGEPAGAASLLQAIPTPAERVRGQADVALILAATGRHDEARAFLAPAEAEVEAVLDEYNVAFVASSMAGAYAALGDVEAEAWFDRARAAIEPETNPGEHRLAVAWALIECGRVEEARALWREGDTPSTFYSVPLLAYLVLTRRDGLARELLTFRDGAEAWQAQGWFDGWEAPELFASLGRPDLLRDWAAVHGDGYAWEELLTRAEANVRPGPRPTQADLAALAEAHTTLLKTPRTQRERPTEQLIVQAATCGHLGAVVDLLSELSARDFNGRAGYAFRALWITALGADVEPW